MHIRKQDGNYREAEGKSGQGLCYGGRSRTDEGNISDDDQENNTVVPAGALRGLLIEMLAMRLPDFFALQSATGER